MLHRARQLLRVGAGVSAGVVVAAVGQGQYLNTQYAIREKLKPPSGPFTGIAKYLAEAQPLQRFRSSGSAVAASTTSIRDAARAAANSCSSAPRAPKKKNILFVGDSLVCGIGCTDAERGPTLPRRCAEAIAKQLHVDVQWTAIGEVGADVRGLNLLLPAVGQEVRRAQEMGGDIDVVVVVVGLNDIKKAYQSATGASHTQRRPQRPARAAHGAT